MVWPFKRKTGAQPQPAAAAPPQVPIPAGKRAVSSLLAEMQDGREYQSLLDCVPTAVDFRAEFRAALAEIEAIRGKPALLYIGNVAAAQPHPNISITASDELPFAEMVDAVPAQHREVDVIVVTGGGSAQTVSFFVDKLRKRFDRVNFIIPSTCMSAGTIFVLSGDEIWMDERAYIGPIDPQIPNREASRYVPMMALWVLLKKIQDEGQRAIAAGGQPDWSYLQLLRNMDPKDLGDALSASAYSTNLVTEYLERYKFRDWTVRASSGLPVDATYRRQRAQEIAAQLCDHHQWKMHSHRIPRDEAERTLRLRISRLESVPGFARAVHRLWALMYFFLENTPYLKLIMSQDYALFRMRTS